MTDTPSTARRGPRSVVVTGAAVLSALGRGVQPLLSAALDGVPAFAPVQRFDVSGRRVDRAATHPGSPVLAEELERAVGEACDEAGLSTAQRTDCPLYLAVHGDPALARASVPDRPAHGADAFADAVARRAGLSGTSRAYTSACVASSTAVADAAAAIAHGHADRIVVAAGYLVEADQFAVFDAGRALARDGQVRPFSSGRTGLLLGDGVAAVVVEAAPAARARRARPLALLAGWGRTGDAYHVCRPRPDGAGLARAITDALHRGGVGPDRIGYVNAHGTGTPVSDTAEAAALHRALGDHAATVPVSSTKSVHGQALEAGALLELVVTIAALRAGRLPVNAGYLGPDESCALNLVLDRTARTASDHALSLSTAFGGANTALLVGTP
ncbi:MULTISPECIES: beta-ketoacyl synthase N-terminal-like domain-containing protein [unclassified Kitasatospora]|uniref:beta-ketoacyl synthase N-terminal-like domain-containing protein n=1 Tax=unclassified Kitasatospora TaxID=2633591 RepID=UPI0007099388|nr:MULTISPECIES: beta-ketoacyl synthase N-terminal-like domain-containing protein [unclassified Kitasatospora]KQV13396.1 3-ketoacyl-ACP synthase [Kitasatospora sp. Root107]KRB75674.1 3-ketoacyl-ACP synthase [Kitasatospora sp. Root187]